MELFELVAVLITLAALFSYLNDRWIKLPTTIVQGLTIGPLVRPSLRSEPNTKPKAEAIHS